MEISKFKSYKYSVLDLGELTAANKTNQQTVESMIESIDFGLTSAQISEDRKFATRPQIDSLQENKYRRP